MNKRTKLALLLLFLFFALNSVNNRRKAAIGSTLFKPTGVKHDTSVDLEKKLLTGTVSFKGNVYLTVFVNLRTDTVHVHGSLEELNDLSMDRESYINMFISEAKCLIHTTNPEED